MIAEFDPLTGKKTQELEFVKDLRQLALRHAAPDAVAIDQGHQGRAERSASIELNAPAASSKRSGSSSAPRSISKCWRRPAPAPGIENYSRYLTGRRPGEPPPTLFEYLPDNALVFTDESHVTIPQIGGMYRGDFRRKATLAEYGFRLPSCMDNRPLRFEEWEAMRPQTVHVSATPGNWEMERTGGVFVEQVIRPTGLIDPPVEIRPARSQVDDLLGEVREVSAAQAIARWSPCLTKRMAEDLTEYLHENGVRVRYMHSDIDTIERIEIIRDLRLGAFDVLVGINLLREGLDIPECALVAILDADKEGFLRSETSLVQTIGRAARNIDGQRHPLRRSDHRLDAARDRRDQPPSREAEAYNIEHGITPASIKRGIAGHSGLGLRGRSRHGRCRHSAAATAAGTIGHNLRATIADLEKRMRAAAGDLEFEEAGAAARRDQAPAGGRARSRRRPAGAPAGDRGPRPALTRASASTGRAANLPANTRARKADRRRYGPAQLGRRRSAPAQRPPAPAVYGGEGWDKGV